MKILIISGFLGAGKTTFIKELAQRTKRDFVVLENEYGEVGIDGNLLSQEEEAGQKKMNVWELTEGCVCCSMKSDFATSILTIGATFDPEFLIVEPTGVGLLSKVIENVKQIEYEKIKLLAPITILDGHSYERYIKEFSDIYVDQIATASTVLVSKMETMPKEDLLHLEENLKSHAHNAEIVTEHYKTKEQEWWNNLLTQSLTGDSIPTNDADAPDLENIGLTSISLKNENELIFFLYCIVGSVFGNIVRAKGYLNFPSGAWLRFDVVDKTFAITGIEPMEDTRAVFIGKDLNRYQLRKVLQRNML